MYKLYYDTFPENRVFQQELSTIVGFEDHLWNPNKNGTVHNLMSYMGIQYKWTSDITDPNAVVIIEVDSQPSDIMRKIFDKVSKNYKKAIVVTTTEPNTTGFNFDEIKKLYPNILFVCCGDHYLNKSLNNIALFPFYIIRPVVPPNLIETHNFKNSNFLTDNKSSVFNHLSKNWNQSKYKMHYTIKNYSKVPSILTYRPINFTSFYPEERKKLIKFMYDVLKERHKIHCENDTYSKIYPYEDFINRTDPYHKDCYPAEMVESDPINKDPSIGDVKLIHPYLIYGNSYISVVTEVETGVIIFDKSTGFLYKNPIINYHNISEKLIQPILNNHIFIANVGAKYNTEYLKNKLGFEIFEEIFDYNFIEKDDLDISVNHGRFPNFTDYNIIQNLNNFKKESIFDNSKIIAEKIHHNKDLILNPNSSLRQSLKTAFEDILNKYLEMDP